MCVVFTHERFFGAQEIRGRVESDFKSGRNQNKQMASHRLTEAGPGRPKGMQNALTVSLKEAIQNAFTELGGMSYLVHVGRTDPRTFCALLSKLLPTKLANADGSPLLAALTELTDAQLEDRTRRALADAQRVGLMAPTGAVIEMQAEAVTAQSVSATETGTKLIT